MNTAPSVLVTGSNSGFGLLITKTLATAGYRVAASMRGVHSKNAAAAQSLREWATQHGVHIHIVEIDVTSDASVEHGVAEAAAHFGGLDVVVNNAGMGTLGLAETFTADQLQAVFDINVFGLHRVIRATLPYLRKSSGGLIINISSGLGRYVMPIMGPYGASKFAVEALVEAYSYELAPQGIECVLIQPGAFGTDFANHSLMGKEGERANNYGPLKDLPQQMGQFLASMFSSPNAPKPQDVADAVLGLLKTERGQRPLRTVVDAFNGQSSAAINATCAQVTAGMFAGMHMSNLLKVKV